MGAPVTLQIRCIVYEIQDTGWQKAPLQCKNSAMCYGNNSAPVGALPLLAPLAFLEFHCNELKYFSLTNKTSLSKPRSMASGVAASQVVCGPDTLTA